MDLAVVCADAVAELGEGPRWDAAESELTWVDILGGRLYRADVSRGCPYLKATHSVGGHLGAAVRAEAGGWIVAVGTGLAWLRQDGEVRWLSEPEADRRGVVRMNDAACDPAGRLWAGSMAYDNRPGAGSLFRIDADLSVRRMLTGTTISNGIGWSRDGTTMWFIDSDPGTIDAFDYDLATGEIENRRTVVRIDPAEGVPDGLAIDAEDCLWVAVWDGAAVRRYSPQGELLAVIELPVSRPTSCCFGGEDLSTMFITSAWTGLCAERRAVEPLAGRLFATRPGVCGVAAVRFAGMLGADATLGQ